MGARAPMPRWYDFAVVWLGLQVLVMAAFLAAVHWLIPDLGGAPSTIVYVAGLAVIALASYRLRRSLLARDVVP